MTIYYYVPNRDALHALVVNHILSEIQIPPPAEGGWEDRLRKLERQARQVFRKHPGIAGQLRETTFAEATRLSEGVFSILRDGGFSHSAAALCFTTLYTFMTGQIDLDAMAGAMQNGWPESTVEGTIDPKYLTADDIFEFGFDVLIEGLKTKLCNRSS